MWWQYTWGLSGSSTNYKWVWACLVRGLWHYCVRLKTTLYLDKFSDRFSNWAVTGLPHKRNKTKDIEFGDRIIEILNSKRPESFSDQPSASAYLYSKNMSVNESQLSSSPRTEYLDTTSDLDTSDSFNKPISQLSKDKFSILMDEYRKILLF